MPMIESLETRQLFAGILLQGHTLRIAGATPQPNVITVGLTADGLSIEAKLTFTNKKGPQLYDKIFALTKKITLIHITGGSGADSITIDQTYGSFPIRTSILGGAGNDTIIGGDERDSICGANGNDLIEGGGGNDTIYGGAGNDTIIGGDGNNYLNGGLGHDSVVGSDGNDTLADAYGPDTMYGGAGHNLFIVSVIGQDVTDFNSATDRVKIVSISSTNTVNSILNAIFPISSLF